MKLKAAYRGVVLTDRCLQVHFQLTIGDQVVRHHHVKIPVEEFSKEVFAKAMDTAARRRLLQVWAQQDDEPIPWNE